MEGAEFKLEDEAGARAVLHKQYAAVVGNPPYITVKDAALRERYRKLYSTAFRGYSLAVPFKERFFQLAKKRGYIGMITANSLTKREFGTKLIEEYLPTVNLETVINTAGAYIPGHGTPTLLLFGTSEKPQSETVLTVRGNRGEPSTPDDPEKGLVWTSIANHWDTVGFDNEYISVTRTTRASLGKHPWSLGGGGATELKGLFEERAEQRLVDIVLSIGRVAHTGNDEAYVAPEGALRRFGLTDNSLVPVVEGEIVRDWALGSPTAAAFPFDKTNGSVVAEDMSSPLFRFLWPRRTMLWLRREPNGTHREIGLTWYQFSRFHPERFEGTGVAFAFVATHESLRS